MSLMEERGDLRLSSRELVLTYRTANAEGVSLKSSERLQSGKLKACLQIKQPLRPGPRRGNEGLNLRAGRRWRKRF